MWFFGSDTVPYGQWFTMDVITSGTAVEILVDGKPTAYHDAPGRHVSGGHIALQQYSPDTVIEFRKVEIRERSSPAPKDPREIGRFLGHRIRVNRAAFLPDGLKVVSGGRGLEVARKAGGGPTTHGVDYALRLWSVAGEQQIFSGPGEGAIVAAIAISSDGRYAASAPGYISAIPMLVWDLKSGIRVHRLSMTNKKTDRDCEAVSFSADDRLVMAATRDSTVRVWDLATEKEQPPIVLKDGPSKPDKFTCAAFTPDRRHLVTGRRTGAVELWDLRTGVRVRRFAGHPGEVACVAGSADGVRVVSGAGNALRFWDGATGAELKPLKGDHGRIYCVALRRDGRRALSGGVDGVIRLWDLAGGSEVCRLEGHAMKVGCVEFSPDGRRAVSGSDDKTVRLWQLPE